MAHCLIISAQENVYRQLVDTVINAGHECITCETAEEARAVFSDWEPDLSLIDTAMPSEHGVALCWDLRLAYNQTPIIVIDSEPGIWLEDDIHDCGANQILTAPLNQQELSEAIQSCFAAK